MRGPAQEAGSLREASEPALASELAGVLTRMGGVLLSAETVETALQLVVNLAAQTIPGSVGAGVTVVDAQGKRTTAATDPLVEEIDALQYALDSGPCLTAWRDQTTVRVDDVTADDRWPQWSHATAGLGVSSVLSSPLVVGGESIGAVKVYSATAGAFDQRSTQILGLFADQAAILLANTRTMQEARELAENLARALESRDLIGQAKGILMAQGAASGDEAFRMLVSASQRTNVRLADVARELVEVVLARQHRRHGAVRDPRA